VNAAALELEDIETGLLLEAIHRRYGYDFRGYARGTLERRLKRRIQGESVRTLSQLQGRLLRDPLVMDRLLEDLTVSVTAMFRDPGFYRAFREKIVPLLRTYPFVRIWNSLQDALAKLVADFHLPFLPGLVVEFGTTPFPGRCLPQL
jgi:chemotaxis protein methyltransferase CheR